MVVQLGVHHSTVERVLVQADIPKALRLCQRSILDPHTPFLVETLRESPRLNAVRLYVMAEESHYSRGGSQFPMLVAQLRQANAPYAPDGFRYGVSPEVDGYS